MRTRRVIEEADLVQFQKNMQRIKGTVGGGGERPTPTRPVARTDGKRVMLGERQAKSQPSCVVGIDPTPPPLTQSFFVPGPLPGANDIIRKHHMVYSTLKSQWGLTIARCIIVAKLKRVRACTIDFLWQEKHNRRDDDNIMFGQKFVLDALRDTKIIPDDRRQFVYSLTHRVIVEPTNPGVLVTVQEIL